MTKCIVLTGGIGSGKSTVRNIFENLGYITLNADQLAREVVMIPEVVKKLQNYFGSDIYDSEMQLNRQKLRETVFYSEEKKAYLESVTHPAIAELFENYKNKISALSQTAWLIYEAPIIIESNRHKDFDAVLLVTANDQAKIKRLKDFRNLDQDLSKKIIQSQLTDEEKQRHADFVIDNSGSKEELFHKVITALKFFEKKFHC